MHPIRWAAVTALAAVTLLGVACSGDDAKTEATATKAAASATAAAGAATAAPTSAPTAAAATAAATIPTVTPAGADGTVKAIISGFKLPTLTVKTGAVVEFVNQDTTGHTATSADDKTFNSGTLTLNGGSFKFTASKAGTFPYACMIHPDMKGSITVQ